MKALPLLVALTLAGTFTFAGYDASAQPDWGVDGGDARRDEIIRRYRTILEARPEEGAIFDRLLQEVGGGHRFESLAEDYARRAEESPDRFAYHMLLGHLLKHADRLVEAEAAYGRAVETSPEDHRAHQSLAHIFRRLDRREEAEQTYEIALGLAEDDDDRRDILRALADLAFEARDWERAGDYVERIIAEDPRDAYTRMELADIFIRYERFEDALQQYEEVADLAGRDTRQRAIAIKDAGDVLALMGRTEEALERYRQAGRLVDDGYWLSRELEQRIVAVYRQDDRLDELVAEWEDDWSRPSVRQLNLLASLYDELGREDDAVEAYRRALSRDSRSIDTRMALIRVLERRGDMEEVLDQYESLVRADRSDASIRFRLVDVYRRLGDREAAVEVLDDMADDFSSRGHVLIDIAERYVRFGERDKALETYERLVRVDSDEADNYIALGEFHFMEGRRSEAERTWRRILDVVDDEAEAHGTLARVYGDHGLVEEAIIEMERAHRLDGENDAYVRELAKYYEDGQRLPDSLTLWTELLERSEQTHIRREAREALVRIYLALGQLQDVIPEFRAQFDAEPRNVEAGYFVGAALLELGNEERAESLYNELLGLDEADIIALLSLEGIYTRAHRHDEAIDVLLTIAEAHPQRAREYYHRLAELSLRMYDDDAAVRFAQLAVELNPNDAQAHARLAEIYRQMQHLDDAVLAYRQALLLDERAFGIYFELAEIFLATNRPGDADELYQHVLSESNDEVYILRAGRRSIQINHATETLEEIVGLIEPHLYDDATGETYLKLLVELYERLTMPLTQTATYGIGSDREDASERLEVIGRRALRPLLDALTGEDQTVRHAALRVLSAQANPNAALPISRLMESSDPEVRADAALAVARIADPRALAPASRAAEEAGSPIELVAIWAVARMRAPEAIPILTQIADDTGRRPEARALAMVGLGHFPDEASATESVLAGLGDESPLVQTAALRAAGTMDLDEASDFVQLMLAHSRGTTPTAAAWALGAMTPSEENVVALLNAYVFGAPDVRPHAARALASIGRSSLEWDEVDRYDRSLVFFDRTTRNLDVSRYLSRLFAWDLVSEDPGSSAVLPEYQSALNAAIARGLGADPGTRRALLADLDRMPDRLALGAVTAGMAGEPLAAHISAIEEALLASLPRLEALGTTGDPLERARALSVRSKLADPGARGALLGCLSSENATVLAECAKGLARVGRTDDAEPLVALSTHDDWVVRGAAIRAIVRMGDPGQADVLRDASADPFMTVRAAALDGLLVFGVSDAESVIGEQWSELPASVRMQLGRRAHELEAASILEFAAEDPDRRVREAAQGE